MRRLLTAYNLRKWTAPVTVSTGVQQSVKATPDLTACVERATTVCGTSAVIVERHSLEPSQMGFAKWVLGWASLVNIGVGSGILGRIAYLAVLWKAAPGLVSR
jgi:hypothetical protein